MALGLAGIKSDGIFFAGRVPEAGRDTGWTAAGNQPDNSGVEGFYPEPPLVSDRAELYVTSLLTVVGSALNKPTMVAS
jgi:hypothetical protein